MPDASERSRDEQLRSLKEIEAIFHNESSGLQQKIGRSIADFTVALFAVSQSKEGDLLELGGTGTLVAVAGCHYILTAAHVWERVLKSAVKVGITLKEGVDHRFLMDVNTIVPSGVPKPNAWGEWGPDLTFLRVPDGHVGSISAYRVFYNLTMVRPDTIDVGCLEIGMLMGTPAELGQFVQTHAEVRINGLFLDVGAPYTHGDFDYVDLDVDVSSPSPALSQDFGGVSGGGLWQVLIYRSALTDEIEWRATLEGVAFHQSALVNGHRIIRCHGKQSMRAAMPNATPSN